MDAKIIRCIAAATVAACTMAAGANTAKIGKLTWSYRVLDGWYDSSAGDYGEYVDERIAVVTGVKGVNGKLTIPARLGGYAVRYIGSYAFDENSAITSVVIPEGVVGIGDFAFEECRKLKSVTLPEGLQSIGYDAFCGCRSLGDVTIPSTVAEGIAFCFCYGMGSITVAEDNPWFKSIDGVVYSKDGDVLVCFPPGRTGEWTVPDDVVEIADEAFGGGQLSAVNIHAGVESIGLGGVFVECRKLTRISVDTGNEWYKDVDGVLFSKDGTVLIAYPAGKKDVTVYTVPQSVARLGDDVFSGCAFTGVILPATLSDLSYETFEGCEKLTSVILGTGLETITSEAFYYAPKLKTLTLPASVQQIEGWAFDEAESLKTIYYPAGAWRDSYAFSGCPAKKTAYSSARLVKFDLNHDDAGEYRYDRNVVNGQPVGILPTPTRAEYGFAGWYTAPEGGTKISSATKIAKDSTFYARWARTVTIVKEGSGTVTGGGNKTVGSEVTLVAKPAKDWTFAGWEAWWGLDEEGDYTCGTFSRQLTFSFTMPDDAVDVHALFVRKSKDYAPIIQSESSTWYVADGEDDYIYVDSLSYSTLTASNLPKGISLKGESYVEDGDNAFALVKTGATKPGVYSVKLTATNRSGKSSTKTIKVVTPNIVDESSITIDAAKRYEVSAGFAFDAAAWEALEISALDGWKITAASGIPGLSWKNGKLTGVPSAPGVHCVTFTLMKGKQSKMATATFVVNPLPSGVTGTYYGYTGIPDTDGEWDEENEEYVYSDLAIGRKSKSITLTIGSGGKISAKVGSRSLTGTGVSYDSDDGMYYVRAQLKKKSGKKTYDYVLEGTVDPSTGSFDGSYCEFSCSGSSCITGWTNDDWGAVARKRLTDLDVLAKANAAGKRGMFVLKANQGYGYPDYTLECPECCIYCGKLALFAKADKNGKVTLSGKIAGKTVSGTAWLQRSELDKHEDNVAYFFSAGFAIKIVYYIEEDDDYINVYGEVWRSR